MKRNKELDKFIPLCSYDEYGGVWTRDAVYKIMEAYNAAMQARIEKLEHLEAVAIDVNQWLCDNGLRGTAHQRCLEQALEGDK